MKPARLLFTLTFLGCVTVALAQFITHRSHLNAVSEEQARKAASQLFIGMAQRDAVRQLTTNGLRATSGTRDTNRWSSIYCFTNGRCDLWLEFRQKPGPTGLIMEAQADYSKGYTVETTNPFVAVTNGILHSVLFRDVQIARTNAP
jgi:hypothetical protein